MNPNKYSKTYSNGVFLLPEQVNSSVSYRIVIEGTSYIRDGQELARRSFDSSINLADCNRSISWSGYGESGIEDMRTKAKRTIKILNKFLKDLDKAEKKLHSYPVTKED